MNNVGSMAMGTSRAAAGQTVLDRLYNLTDGESFTTFPVRILGMSRVTLQINQLTGAGPGTVDIYTVQGAALNASPIVGHPYGTVTITAVGLPEVVELTNLACRLIYFVIHAPVGIDSDWQFNMHATGAS